MFRSKLLVSMPLASLFFLATEGGLSAQTIDPAVTSLGASVRKGAVGGRPAEIAITGTVKNIGTKDFKSSAGQQSVRLYVQAAGRTPVVVKEWAFINLKAGETLTFSVTRGWLPKRAGFNPDFFLQIDLDPDIYADGNPNNDDANQMNNRRTLTARTIDSLFSRPPGKK
jgi:hypothetical protein